MPAKTRETTYHVHGVSYADESDGLRPSANMSLAALTRYFTNAVAMGASLQLQVSDAVNGDRYRLIFRPRSWQSIHDLQGKGKVEQQDTSEDVSYSLTGNSGNFILRLYNPPIV